MRPLQSFGPSSIPSTLLFSPYSPTKRDKRHSTLHTPYQHTVVRLRLAVQQQQLLSPPRAFLPTPFHPTMMVQSSILSFLALSALSVTPAAAAGHHNGHSSSAHHQRRFGLAGRKGHAAAHAHQLEARDIHGRQLPGTMAMRKRSDGSTCKVRPVSSSSVASSSVAASSAAPSSSAVASSTAPVSSSSAAAPSSSSTEDEWTQTSSTAAAATSSAWVAPTTTSVRSLFLSCSVGCAV